VTEGGGGSKSTEKKCDIIFEWPQMIKLFIKLT